MFGAGSYVTRRRWGEAGACLSRCLPEASADLLHVCRKHEAKELPRRSPCSQGRHRKTPQGARGAKFPANRSVSELCFDSGREINCPSLGGSICCGAMGELLSSHAGRGSRGKLLAEDCAPVGESLGVGFRR